MRRIWIFCLIILFGVVIVLFPRPHQQGPQPFPSSGPGSPRTYEWHFVKDESDTLVTLILDRSSFNLGHYRGSCFEIDGASAPYLVMQEIIGAQCWSSKGGDEEMS
jgi:hypothetical protein